MHQRGGLERVVVLFARQPVRGQAAQFVIDQRQQFCGGARIASRGSLEQLGDVGQATADYRRRTMAASFVFRSGNDGGTILTTDGHGWTRMKTKDRHEFHQLARSQTIRDQFVMFVSPNPCLSVSIRGLFLGRLHWQRGERKVFVRLAKIIRRPLVLEKNHGIFADVVGDARTRGQ